jgi:hypothetical protein
MPNQDLILSACREEFAKYKRVAEKAFAQLGEQDFHFRLNAQQNSIAAIVKHLVGNMRSRWTDFLNSDGEKPDRNREAEFVDDFASHAAMMRAWENGWACLFAALNTIADADLSRTVYIRNEPHTVFQAINRQTAHYAQHVGQILVIAKHIKGPAWQWITIPPGGSEAFNRKMGMR